jgi:hypothetical protein
MYARQSAFSERLAVFKLAANKKNLGVAEYSQSPPQIRLLMRMIRTDFMLIIATLRRATRIQGRKKMRDAKPIHPNAGACKTSRRDT